MIITSSTLASLQQGFNAAFKQGFGSVTPSLDQIAMRVPSSTKTENYGWMKDLPGMREWVGQRTILNLESSSAALTNKDYEHTIGVDRNDIEDDRLGIYSPMFMMQGEIVAQHPDSLVWSLLLTGFAANGFDGQYFFDTDHVGYTSAGAETSWSNTGAGSGGFWCLMDLSRNYMRPVIFQERKAAEFVSLNRSTDPNVFMERQYLFGAEARYVAGFGFHQLAYGSKSTLDASAFNAGRLAMETQRRPDGSPLPVMATHLVCGPTRRAEAEAILMKEYLASGESNTNYKAVNLIVNPYLG
ncbi:MAG: Mu-like prophage major head subunit gpT family protein [Chitinophagaceae bacterium]|nr:Mu-like prophage major head subunit gpT family protein [Chitinophagaceae bacterium]